MKQWMLKIPVYAERLLQDLDGLDWPEGVKEMQRNWIGKSLGAEIKFAIKGTSHSMTVYTTRPDTLFGVTYCVLSPEHPLVDQITTPAQKDAVQKYVTTAKQKSELARTDLAKDKSGIATGAFAIHPVTGKEVPIWVADYVLMSYGTGSVMAVPAHDERDHEFALKFKLPITEVISGGKKPVTELAHTEDGTLVHSDFLNGLTTEPAKKAMVDWLEKNKKGTSRIQFRLRDWLFSRQRYWGEPFPIVHLEDGKMATVPINQLPVELPTIDQYRPTDDGQPPLARAGDDWLMVTLPDGRKGVRETNTMPQWAGSCWYYLRYIDAKNNKEAWNRELEKYWMPVDLYVGGVEHAVLHLLYSRFWHKVLFDCGLVTTKEPFQKLFNQGMILAYSYRDSKGKYYHPDEIEERQGKPVVKATGEGVESQIEKMSKSKLNVVNPDDVIQKYGADSMRLYELFMGPLEQVKPWQMDGVEGVSRFLHRVWRWLVNEETGALSAKLNSNPGASEPALWKLLHKSIKKVQEDTEGLRFNTAISQMMVFINEAYLVPTLPKEIGSIFLKLLAPYAPHLAEELWEKLGHKTLLAQEGWPTFDASLIVDDEALIIIQVNGKKRGEISLPKTFSAKEIEAKVLSTEAAIKFMEGKTPKRVIVVPGRLVNIVI